MTSDAGLGAKIAAEPLSPPPVFADDIAQVSERVRKMVGKATVPNMAVKIHPLIARLLDEDDAGVCGASVESVNRDVRLMKLEQAVKANDADERAEIALLERMYGDRPAEPPTPLGPPSRSG